MRTISTVIILLAISFVINVKILFVSGQSMEPTIKNGQIVLTIIHYKELDLGDIVAFKNDTYGHCIKRIIAKPSDVVELKDGKIIINGIILSRYICANSECILYELGNDQYFVIGDNYNASIDSRNFGPINKSDIIGKVVLF